MSRLCFKKRYNLQNTFLYSDEMNSHNFLNFRALRLFIAVFDSQSFSLVARNEGVSPSLVTRTINQLEDALGQQLFYRNTRAVIPTEAGQLFVTHARAITERMGEAQTELQEKESEPSGQVRINGPVVFGHRHIAPWLAELYARYPRLSVELTQTDSYIDPHKDGTDLIFRIGVLADSTYQARIFGPQVHQIVASPAYLKRYGKPASPQALIEHHCLGFNGPKGLNRWYFRQQNEIWQHYPLTTTLVSNNADTLMTAALSGMGIILFPDWLTGEYVKSGQLVSVLEGYEASTTLEQQQIAAIYPNTRKPPLKVRAVIDFYVEKFGSPLYWRTPL